MYRTLLFVPGCRPDRFEKAAKAGADGVIIDLEDAVLPEDKARARAAAIEWLSENTKKMGIGVRINSPRTSDGCADIAAFAEADLTPAFVMVPKAETGTDIEVCREALKYSNLIATIESGRGLFNAAEIAAESPAGLLFGGVDYSASLGADLSDWDAMLTPRAMIAAACGAQGIQAFDAPYLDVENASGLRETTLGSKRIGFSGRMCIHPKQVAVINACFKPSQEEIDDARDIVAALQLANGGAVLHKGKMVDKPVILSAQRLLSAIDDEED